METRGIISKRVDRTIEALRRHRTSDSERKSSVSDPDAGLRTTTREHLSSVVGERELELDTNGQRANDKGGSTDKAEQSEFPPRAA